jgi:hypothetical protein
VTGRRAKKRIVLSRALEAEDAAHDQFIDRVATEVVTDECGGVGGSGGEVALARVGLQVRKRMPSSGSKRSERRRALMSAQPGRHLRHGSEQRALVDTVHRNTIGAGGLPSSERDER